MFPTWRCSLSSFICARVSWGGHLHRVVFRKFLPQIRGSPAGNLRRSLASDQAWMAFFCRFQVADRGNVRLRQARCFGKQIGEGRVSPGHSWNHWKQPQGGPKTSRLDLQVISHNKSILLWQKVPHLAFISFNETAGLSSLVHPAWAASSNFGSDSPKLHCAHAAIPPQFWSSHPTDGGHLDYVYVYKYIYIYHIWLYIHMYMILDIV